MRPPFATYGIFEVIGGPIAGAPIVPLANFPLFSPDDMTDLICWYAADAGATPATNNTALTLWPAVTSNGVSVGPDLNHVEAHEPVYVSAAFPSGVPGAGISPYSSAFISTALGKTGVPYLTLGSNPWSFAFTVKRLDTTGLATMFGQGQFYANWAQEFKVGFQSGVGPIAMTMGNGLLNVTGSTSITVGQNYVVVVTYDGTSRAAGVNFYLNGVAETSTVVSDALTAPINQSTEYEFFVGHKMNSDSTSATLSAILGEVFGAAHVFTATEIANVTAYLRARSSI